MISYRFHSFHLSFSGLFSRLNAFLLVLGLCQTLWVSAQLGEEKKTFTRADSLRGTLTQVRTWFDVGHYDLHLTIDPTEKALFGYNDIYFKVLKPSNTMQIDLFFNMQADSIVFAGKNCAFSREGNAVFIQLPEKDLALNSVQKIRFYYHGKPTVAKNAPWDGGFVWKKDNNGNAWVGVACQGFGASSWFPNKDHQSDEPDSVRVSCAVPKGLFCVSNGRFLGKSATQEQVAGQPFERFNWAVSYPINNYDITINIGDYAHFNDYYVSNNDTLQLNYYVLSYNLERAKRHFAQVKPMMQCYEKYFGPYPFWKDGFALVETHYLGMEHQSAVAYGNRYLMGYTGYDITGTDIGNRFDYIIIHEAGHEWWGNSITTADIADMWVHEGFCTYGESLYVECMYGKEDALRYVNGSRARISNDIPIIGPYGVNEEGSGDMYAKGAILLNTLRSLINNDEIWFGIIRGLNNDFKHQIVNSQQVEQYINQKAGQDFSKVFDQYLRHTQPPTLLYKTVKKGRNTELSFKWQADVKDFDMPIAYFAADGSQKIIRPQEGKWQKMLIPATKPESLKFAEDYYYFLLNKQ